MEQYTGFAHLYDEFMDNVPYREWAERIRALISSYGENVKSVLDLGCGTGTMTELISDLGYDVMGVDISEDMLSIAQDKAYEHDKDILYINQDMRELELLEKADVVYSVCDCINYLITDEDVIKTFKSVHDNMERNGIFIFDFNTVYKYENVIGNRTIAEVRDDCSFIWENYYSTEDHINEFDVTFFAHIDGEDDDIYQRFDETHIQRGYELSEIRSFADEAGFRFIIAGDATTGEGVSDTSERIYVVLRK